MAFFVAVCIALTLFSLQHARTLCCRPRFCGTQGLAQVGPVPHGRYQALVLCAPNCTVSVSRFLLPRICSRQARHIPALALVYTPGIHTTPTPSTQRESSAPRRAKATDAWCHGGGGDHIPHALRHALLSQSTQMELPSQKAQDRHSQLTRYPSAPQRTRSSSGPIHSTGVVVAAEQ